MNIDVSN